MMEKHNPTQSGASSANTKASLETKPGIKTVMTAEVRYDKRLSSTEKIIYSEIAGLYKKHKVCWATNAHFAKKFGLTIKTISRCITHLAQLGFIRVEINQEEGNKRSIFLCDDTPKMSRPMDIPEDTSGQNEPEETASLLIYNKNIKNKDEREGDSQASLKSENFSVANSKSEWPDQQQVESYMLTLKLPWLNKSEGKEARSFVDYYSALGWQMKAGPIQDWQAAARNWLNKTQNISQTLNNHSNEHSKINKGNNQWRGHVNRLNTDRGKEYSGTL
ncbi:helix-turn-helix domain-containing protein [Pontibacter sp. MBLB2868]|uniref:helix-turn-helix domain-containing protein n=1 Tax=Pontibacter sp. MBLB2868 TaxID=3451555 RepID=UPI003F7523B1